MVDGVDIFATRGKDDTDIVIPNGLDVSDPACMVRYVNQNLIDAGVSHISKLVWNDSESASMNYEEESLDFIFLDGGHNYETVMKDIKVWWPKLRGNGIMAGHDYNALCWIGVIAAVRESFKDEQVSLFPDNLIRSPKVWYVKKDDWLCPVQ